MASFSSKQSKFSVMYQILPLCKKHGSYTCRATLRNFVGTCRNYSYTARRYLTLCAMCRNLSYKIQQNRNISYKILQKFSIKLYTCRNHVSYTSVKFLPALYLKIMVSYLIWNMLCKLTRKLFVMSKLPYMPDAKHINKMADIFYIAILL